MIFFWLVAAWVKSRAERPSVSGVNRQLHVQIGCKLIIRNRKDELTRQAERNKLQITNYKLNPKGIKGVNACRKRKRSSKTLPAEGIGYIPVTRGHREGSVTAPCAIEYILVTRWRRGKKGGQNRVCACDTKGGSS